MRDLDGVIAAPVESMDAAEVFDELDEMSLAAELLDVTNDRELDQFLGQLVRRASDAIGSAVKGDMARAVGGMLKRVAKRSLPILGSAVGGAIAGPAGRAAGAQVASAAGRIFGLELEGLSPEDQEFEVARRFVRFGGNAVRNTARVARTASPRAAARAGVLRAARRHAPGLLRPGSVAPPAGRPLPAAGRWFGSGRNVIVINCPQPPSAASPAEPVEAPAPASEPSDATGQPPDVSTPNEG